MEALVSNPVREKINIFRQYLNRKVGQNENCVKTQGIVYVLP
jgi:hypothetical protein